MTDADKHLWNACFFGDERVLKRSIPSGNPNWQNPAFGGDTAIHVASYKGYANIVRILIEETSVDVNAHGENGLSPLHCAVAKGHVDVVALLVSVDGIDLHARTHLDRTPLIMASGLHCDGAIVKLLLERGANPNLISANATPLIWCARYGNVDGVNLLLNHGANPWITFHGQNAILECKKRPYALLMREKANYDKVQQLLEHHLAMWRNGGPPTLTDLCLMKLRSLRHALSEQERAATEAEFCGDRLFEAEKWIHTFVITSV